MMVPSDPSIPFEIRRALQQMADEIDALRSEVGALSGSKGASQSDVDELRRRVGGVEQKPTFLDFNDVMRGSGPAHALGYAPDPGEAAWDERALMETGRWGYPLLGLIRVVTRLGVFGDVQFAGDILNVLGSMAIIGNIGAAKAYLKDLEVTGIVSGLVENHGGTLVDASGFSFTAPLWVFAWTAPYACRVLAVKGYRVGGTGATVNARLNGTSNHLGSDLSLTSADTVMDGGVVQNNSYVAGDRLEIGAVTYTGTVTQIGISVYFTRA
jgi:hypothetical protein